MSTAKTLFGDEWFLKEPEKAIISALQELASRQRGTVFSVWPSKIAKMLGVRLTVSRLTVIASFFQRLEEMGVAREWRTDKRRIYLIDKNALLRWLGDAQ